MRPTFLSGQKQKPALANTVKDGLKARGTTLIHDYSCTHEAQTRLWQLTYAHTSHPTCSAFSAPSAAQIIELPTTWISAPQALCTRSFATLPLQRFGWFNVTYYDP